MFELDIIMTEKVVDLFPLEKKHLEKFVKNFFNLHKYGKVFLNIVFVDDEIMTDLNVNYKKREGTTDVLTFLFSENPEEIEGEIYISLEKAKLQSIEYETDYGEETVRLISHGLLHLTGMLHDTEEGYNRMVEETELMIKKYFESRE